MRWLQAVRVRQSDLHIVFPLPARCLPDGTRCSRCRFPTSRQAAGNFLAAIDHIEQVTFPIPFSSASRLIPYAGTTSQWQHPHCTACTGLAPIITPHSFGIGIICLCILLLWPEIITQIYMIFLIEREQSFPRLFSTLIPNLNRIVLARQGF